MSLFFICRYRGSYTVRTMPASVPIRGGAAWPAASPSRENAMFCVVCEPRGERFETPPLPSVAMMPSNADIDVEVEVDTDADV